jgi:CBS domain-containing protein
MWNFDLHALPVTHRSGHVIGIITRRDVRRALESSVESCLVSSVMTNVSESCTPDDDVSIIAAMAPGTHGTRLPVSDGGALVGLLVLESAPPPRTVALVPSQ